MNDQIKELGAELSELLERLGAVRDIAERLEIDAVREDGPFRNHLNPLCSVLTRSVNEIRDQARNLELQLARIENET